MDEHLDQSITELERKKSSLEFKLRLVDCQLKDRYRSEAEEIFSQLSPEDQKRYAGFVDLYTVSPEYREDFTKRGKPSTLTTFTSGLARLLKMQFQDEHLSGENSGNVSTSYSS